MSNITEIKINWIEQKGRTQTNQTAIGAKFTEDDLMVVKIKMNELFDQLQNKIEKTKDESNRVIANQAQYLDKSIFKTCIC